MSALLEMIQTADGNLRDIGHEVVGDAGRIFADETARMSADRVEIAQEGDRPVRVGFGGVAQDLLAHILRPAIGVGAHTGVRILPQGHFVITGIDCGRRGENNVADVMVLHCLTECDSGEEVIVIVFQRHRDGFTNGFEPGKVNHAADIMFIKDGIQRGAVTHVVFVEDNIFAGNLLHSFQRLFAGVYKVIDHNNIVPLADGDS